MPSPKKKVETSGIEPQVNAPNPEASVVNKDITDALGTRRHSYVTTGPVPVGKVGMNDLVQIKQKLETIEHPQPILNFDEAKVLGKQAWREYTVKPGYYCTKVNHRRFLVTEVTLEKLAKEGLIL